MGSPPPMRGKVHKIQAYELCSRITPAYAGKSSLISFIFLFLQDHPRLCGEKWKYRIFLRYYKGSPPPMRGKGSCSGQVFQLPGITPAYAGKSSGSVPSSRTAVDHPRLCGEKSIAFTMASETCGSPPPMRGKGTVLSLQHVRSGITPAYAGKS